MSDRLKAIVNALPLTDGMRILEIGCGTGVAARGIVKRVSSCYMLAIDRSETAIRQAVKGSSAEIESGRLSFRQVAIEHFELEQDEALFDIAFAIRVGALDGRHPEIEKQAFTQIAKALKTNGRLFIDGGNPLKEVDLDPYR
ncbi:MAG: class I SAM-dependent methyltransferase [Sphingobacteriales bacterium]|nr:MAG: class I SAM-dependent methyltransferase [Sphingobacteriales bacterium]